MFFEFLNRGQRQGDYSLGQPRPICKPNNVILTIIGGLGLALTGTRLLITNAQLTVKDQEVLLAMARYGDKQGRGIYPSLATLATDVTQARRESIYGPAKVASKPTLARIRKSLIARELIKEVGKVKTERGYYVPMFDLNLEAIRKTTISGQIQRRKSLKFDRLKKSHFDHQTTKGWCATFELIDDGDV